MVPERKETCDCRSLEQASREPDEPIEWDALLGQYFIVCGDGRRMMISYCHFCGGRSPAAPRLSRFAHVTRAEEYRIWELCAEIRKLGDVTARFGVPDKVEKIEAATVGRDVSETEAKEGVTSFVFTNLSPVADLHFIPGSDDSVVMMWVQKAIEEVGEE